MAVLMTLEVPGGTTAKYDRTNEIMGIADERDSPPGLISHVCGVTGDGILVVDVWDSVISLDDFARNRFQAALEQAEMPDATPHVSPVHNMLFGAGTEANVIVLIDMAGLTKEAYDAIIAKMPADVGSGENHPSVMHVAALEPDGHLRIADVWDSGESFANFAQNQIGPAAGALPPMEPRIVPIYNRMRAQSRAAT
jgi:hypothetical protein